LKRTVLGLVRHGETEWNHQNRLQGTIDIPLSAIGSRQAHCLARKLGQQTWDAIYASDLSRAVTTAQIVANSMSLRVAIDKRLRERNYGPLEGRIRSNINHLYPGLITHGTEHAIEGVEPFASLCERAQIAFEEIAERHAGQRLLIVSHGGWINALLHTISNGQYGTGVNKQENTGVSLLEKSKNRWRVHAVNDVSHFDDGDALIAYYSNVKA